MKRMTIDDLAEVSDMLHMVALRIKEHNAKNNQLATQIKDFEELEALVEDEEIHKLIDKMIMSCEDMEQQMKAQMSAVRLIALAVENRARVYINNGFFTL